MRTQNGLARVSLVDSRPREKGDGLLGIEVTADRLGTTKKTLYDWLSKPKIRRLLDPREIQTPIREKPYTYFDVEIVTVWMKLMPPKKGKGGHRLDDAVLERIEAALNRKGLLKKRKGRK